MLRSGTRRRAASTVACLLVALGGCGDDDAGTAGMEGTVTVLAASSLTDAFTDIASAFEDEHEGVDVAVSFDGSSTLVTQILEGAPADLFASADQANMAKVTDAGLASAPVVFASNELVIVVPPGNPAGIADLGDLGRSGLRLALCAPEVPCGRYAADAFAKAGLTVPSASGETNVKGVVTKVALGEADAGVAYVTDVIGGSVDGIALPGHLQVPTTYPAAVLTDGANPEVAAAFLAFLTGDEAQAILRDAGFGAP